MINNKEELTWQKVLEPVEKITDRLQLSWRVVSHLHNVKDNDDFRKVYSKVIMIMISDCD